MWWCTTVISTWGNRQENQTFKAIILSHKLSLRLAWIAWDWVFKKKKSWLSIDIQYKSSNNSKSQTIEAGESGTQDQTQLFIKLKASLDYKRPSTIGASEKYKLLKLQSKNQDQGTTKIKKVWV